MKYYVLGLQIIELSFFTISIGILLHLLRKQKLLQGEESREVFNKERKTMLMILIIFDLSFVLRAAFDVIDA